MALYASVYATFHTCLHVCNVEYTDAYGAVNVNRSGLQDSSSVHLSIPTFVAVAIEMLRVQGYMNRKPTEPVYSRISLYISVRCDCNCVELTCAGPYTSVY